MAEVISLVYTQNTSMQGYKRALFILKIECTVVRQYGLIYCTVQLNVTFCSNAVFELPVIVGF